MGLGMAPGARPCTWPQPRCFTFLWPAPRIPSGRPLLARGLDRDSRALSQLVAAERTDGPVLLNQRGRRMDRHCATRRLRRLAAASVIRLPRMHPHMLRHTFVTTMLDAGVDLRDVQIAARHADPRTTMRYDRARKNRDRHPNYILAAYMASGI
jgi:integrase/recombinase XerD